MTKDDGHHLRPVLATDIETIWLWRNHSTVRPYMFNSAEISWAEHVAWFERTLGEKHVHALVLEVDGIAAGFANIHERAQGAVAEWGFYKSPDAPGGTGLLLGRAVLSLGFEELNLHKIYAQVLGFNQRSIDLHTALGFEQEGVLKEQHFDGGAFHDVYCFGMRRAKWAKTQSQTG